LEATPMTDEGSEKKSNEKVVDVCYPLSLIMFPRLKSGGREDCQRYAKKVSTSSELDYDAIHVFEICDTEPSQNPKSKIFENRSHNRSLR